MGAVMAGLDRAALGRAIASLLLVGGVLLSAGEATAGRSSVHVGVGIGMGWPGYYPGYYHPYRYYRSPVVVVPPPVYVAPPVYAAPPPPVVYAPPPAYYASPTVSAAPAGPDYVARDGRLCREYQSTAIVGGQARPVYGTACLAPDGSWRIVN